VSLDSTPELQAQLTQTGIKWGPAEWQRFLELPLELQALEVQMYQDAQPDPQAVNGWDTALKVLEVAATVFGEVVGIGSGVIAIKQIVKGT
jgi:hypothetical protein